MMATFPQLRERGITNGINKPTIQIPRHRQLPFHHGHSNNHGSKYNNNKYYCRIPKTSTLIHIFCIVIFAALIFEVYLVDWINGSPGYSKLPLAKSLPYHCPQTNFSPSSVTFHPSSQSTLSNPTTYLPIPILPNWSDSPPPLNSYDLFIPCDPTSCIQHLSDMPFTLFLSLTATRRLRLVYVVSDKEGLKGLITAIEAKKTEVQSSVEGDQWSDQVLLVLLTSDVKEERPPVKKEFRMLEKFRDGGKADAVFTKLDVDTMFNPSNLLKYLDTVDRKSNKVYYGRPGASCDCAFDEKEYGLLGPPGCVYSKAIHYCGGPFYVTTRRTLQAIKPDSFVGANNGTRQEQCRSSDLSVGNMFMHGHSSGNPVHCDVLGADTDTKLVPTYPMNHQSKKKEMIYTNVCQQIGSPGGIKATHTVLDPFEQKWGLEHFDKCVTFHPAKTSQDWLYLWNMVRTGADVVPAVDVQMKSIWANRAGLEPKTQKCRVAAYVLSSPSRPEERQAVRMTWGTAAKAYGIQIRFAVGLPKSSDMAWVETALDYEHLLNGDIVKIDMRESYSTLPEKVARGMADFARRGGDCDFYFKTDADSFIRPYQLIKLLEIEEAKVLYSNTKLVAVSDVMLYIGRIWEKSKVVTDVSSQFYLGDKKVVDSIVAGDGVYPPFASGAGYILSASLVLAMTDINHPSGHGGCYTPETLLSGPEDVQIGMCVDTLKTRGGLERIKVVSAVELQVDVCNSRTIIDNPVSSHGDYNLLQRQEAHLRGGDTWCDLRRFNPGTVEGSRYQPGSNNFFSNVVNDNEEHQFVRRVKSPWEEDVSVDNPSGVYLFMHGEILGDSLQTIGRFCRSGEIDWSCSLEVYKCVNCVENWYHLSRRRARLKWLSGEDGGSKVVQTATLMHDEVNSGGSVFSKAFSDSRVNENEGGAEGLMTKNLDFIVVGTLENKLDAAGFCDGFLKHASELELELASNWPKSSREVYNISVLFGLHTHAASVRGRVTCVDSLTVKLQKMFKNTGKGKRPVISRALTIGMFSGCCLYICLLTETKLHIHHTLKQHTQHILVASLTVINSDPVALQGSVAADASVTWKMFQQTRSNSVTIVLPFYRQTDSPPHKGGEGVVEAASNFFSSLIVGVAPKDETNGKSTFASHFRDLESLVVRGKSILTFDGGFALYSSDYRALVAANGDTEPFERGYNPGHGQNRDNFHEGIWAFLSLKSPLDITICIVITSY